MRNKYHEMKANRKDGNIDADQCQVATDAAAEFAKLDATGTPTARRKQPLFLWQTSGLHTCFLPIGLQSLSFLALCFQQKMTPLP